MRLHPSYQESKAKVFGHLISASSLAEGIQESGAFKEQREEHSMAPEGSQR